MLHGQPAGVCRTVYCGETVEDRQYRVIPGGTRSRWDTRGIDWRSIYVRVGAIVANPPPTHTPATTVYPGQHLPTFVATVPGRATITILNDMR